MLPNIKKKKEEEEDTRRTKTTPLLIQKKAKSKIWMPRTAEEEEEKHLRGKWKNSAMMTMRVTKQQTPVHQKMQKEKKKKKSIFSELFPCVAADRSGR